MKEALDIQVTGVVQGVGFRPFVYREARAHNVAGWVLNTVEGVTIHAEGETDALDRFVMALSSDAPAAAQVAEIDIAQGKPADCSGFEIRFSDDAAAREACLVSPDLATCDACVAELFDPDDRRYRYPFINCTNCGPRFTIIDALPYDRPATSMEPFAMCPTCQVEYDDPANRRFHAQPDACFECGPRLGWIASDGADSAPFVAEGRELRCENIAWARDRASSDTLLALAVAALRCGGIVAVKGLGGYHLVCDAENPAALSRLRERKRRKGKAFAVMAPSIDAVRERCVVSAAEEEQLTSPARPIVLLRKRPHAAFAAGLADDLPELGVMLPTTPVQHLLAHDFGGMLVMTSGNIHDEPIVTDEATALSRLAGVADAFLVNDRAIRGRYDDSVLRVLDAGAAGDAVQFIRRARGFAPLPIDIPLPDGAPDDACLLAVGPEQKNTFTCTRGASAFVSQHIGDVESAPVMDAWDETRRRYGDLFRLRPTGVVCDLHPEYLTSKWADAQDLPVAKAQHHHAHILAVMGENALEGPVCGFAFDGTGYGVDGAIWGGEVLLSNLKAYERFANVAYFPLPGGAAAIKQPTRIAYGALWAFDLLDHPAAQRFVAEHVPGAELYDQMIERGLNCPQTSSMGRLFDAASALCGVCLHPRYEGEAAILFEAALHGFVLGASAANDAAAANDAIAEGEGSGRLAEGADPQSLRQSWARANSPQDCSARAELAWCEPASSADGTALEPYRFDIIKNVATEQSTAADTSVVLIDPAPVFSALLDDVQAGIPVGVIARRFHDAVVDVVVTLAELVRAAYGIEVVALSGGVFMNRYLTEQTLARLQERGFTVALNRDLPPNDASISYGQAVLGLQANSKE